MFKVESGLHTYGLYHRLSYSDAQNLIELLQKRKHCRKKWNNELNIDRIYFSDLFVEQGVRIHIYQSPKHSGVKLIVTPCTLLKGSYAATELYCPDKENYRRLTDRLDAMLKNMKLDFTADEMSVCRADPCTNIFCDDKKVVQEYLRILKKGCRIRGYEPVTYDKNSQSVANHEEANQHSFRIACKDAEFTAYDKVFVLQALDRCSEALDGTGILRIEAELKRDALLKHIHAGRKVSNYEILSDTATAAKEVLTSYLQKILRCEGSHLQYKGALAKIEESAIKPKAKKRMLKLLRKVSDSKSLDAALDKLCLSNKQCNTLLKRFEELDIHPISLRNDSKQEQLPSLLQILGQDEA